MRMPPNRRLAIEETATNAAVAHPEWSRMRCLREAIRIVRKLDALVIASIDAQLATTH